MAPEAVLPQMASPALSMATTLLRNVGQFMATESNMLTYCDPWPENNAATLVLPRTDACCWYMTPSRGNVHSLLLPFDFK